MHCVLTAAEIEPKLVCVGAYDNTSESTRRTSEFVPRTVFCMFFLAGRLSLEIVATKRQPTTLHSQLTDNTINRSASSRAR